MTPSVASTVPSNTVPSQVSGRQRSARRWDLIKTGIICFALGAMFMNVSMRYVFENPIRIGQTEFRYFSEADIAKAFHKQYVDNWWYRTFGGSKWLGVPTMQIPFDTWIMQEIIHEVQPDAILETGTHLGGSALIYATVLDQLKKGHVHTVDLNELGKVPEHGRITYYRGSSTDPAVLTKMKAAIPQGGKTMVVLDSLHEKDHVLKELELYSPLVTVGSYLVVQDTHLNGHPVMQDTGLRAGIEGPYEAVEVFLKENKNFEADRSRERFGVTVSPLGWLKRVR
jgi:cephalosporin hydroxylase